MCCSRCPKSARPAKEGGDARFSGVLQSWWFHGPSWFPVACLHGPDGQKNHWTGRKGQETDTDQNKANGTAPYAAIELKASGVPNPTEVHQLWAFPSACRVRSACHATCRGAVSTKPSGWEGSIARRPPQFETRCWAFGTGTWGHSVKRVVLTRPHLEIDAVLVSPLHGRSLHHHSSRMKRTIAFRLRLERSNSPQPLLLGALGFCCPPSLFPTVCGHCLPSARPRLTTRTFAQPLPRWAGVTIPKPLLDANRFVAQHGF